MLDDVYTRKEISIGIYGILVESRECDGWLDRLVYGKSSRLIRCLVARMHECKVFHVCILRFERIYYLPNVIKKS